MSSALDFQRLHSSSSRYRDLGPAFVFSNENVAGYLSALGGCRNRRVLTVAGGGDHAFEAILGGASHVDTFDVNILQRAVLELKTTLVRHTDYETFMQMTTPRSPEFMNPRLIMSIWDKVSPGTRQLLAMNQVMRRDDLFIGGDAYDLHRISYVASTRRFRDLRTRMPDHIPFMHTDIMNLNAKLDGRYDLILLSNIGEFLYPDVRSSMQRLKNYYDDVLRPLADNHLTNTGRICVGYMWPAPELGKTSVAQTAWDMFWAKFAYDAGAYVAGDRHEFWTISVPSTLPGVMRDAVMVMNAAHQR